jgi:LysM repeat protein
MFINNITIQTIKEINILRKSLHQVGSIFKISAMITSNVLTNKKSITLIICCISQLLDTGQPLA